MSRETGSPLLWIYHGDLQLLFALGKNQSEALELSKWKQPRVELASLVTQVQVQGVCCKNKCFWVEEHS